MQTKSLSGSKIAFLATDGVEQVELDQPWQALTDAGAEPVLVSLHDGTIQMFRHLDHGDKKRVDVSLENAVIEDYDGLVLPGGVVNGDFIRADQHAVEFVRDAISSGLPTGVICHGAWVLAEADVARGRTLTSWPSLRTDLSNAGAHWVDEEVVVDNGLVSSRKPDDLPAFCAKLLEEIGEGIHVSR
jgi:protease I